MVLKRKLPSRVEPEKKEAAEQSAPLAAPETPNQPEKPEQPAKPDPQPITPPPAPETPPSPPPEVPDTPAPVEAPPPSETPEVPPPASAQGGQQPAQPSRPKDSPLKRKVRDKRPRSYAAPKSEQAEKAKAPQPAASTAVPQTDVEFDKVGDKLADMGVAEKQVDSLTQQAAPASAVADTPIQAETPIPSVPDTLPAPEASGKPEDMAKGKDGPDWLAELTKELNAGSKPSPLEEPKQESARNKGLDLPPAPTLPSNLLSGLVEDLPPSAKAEPEASLPAAEDKPAQTSQSDVPWASPDNGNEDWQLDLPESKEGDAPPSTPTPPGDIYAGVGRPEGGGNTPPWQSSGAPPAELPGPRQALASFSGGSGIQLITTAAIIVLVGAGAWWFFSGGDESQERLARWTGSLRETTERLPAEQGGVQNLAEGGSVAPEQTIGLNNSGLLPPPDSTQQSLPGPGGSQVIIDFADVPPEQANKPIMPDGDEDMPEDVSFIASLQQAIAEKKAERGGEVAPAEIEASATKSGQVAAPAAESNAIEKTVRNEALKAQLDAELAAYRKALVEAGNVAEAPRPSEFLGKSREPAKPYMDSAEAQPGELLPPPSQTGQLPPAQTYTNNPANLPVVAEPSSEQAQVRTLADFDVSMFEPERDKVRIPRGIRPRMSLSDFPEMEVLSLVPNKGLIAYHNGTEGVLLIGESVDGWQLVQVGPESAQFRSGERTYYVSAGQ